MIRRLSDGSLVRSRMPPATIFDRRSDRILRAIPSPAWNSSKCLSPLSAPRRIRNAHFSPTISTAAGSGHDNAARLNSSIPDVTLSAGIRGLSPLSNLIKTQFGSKKQLPCETDYDIKLLLATFIEVNSDAPYRPLRLRACGSRFPGRGGVLFREARGAGQWPY